MTTPQFRQQRQKTNIGSYLPLVAQRLQARDRLERQFFVAGLSVPGLGTVAAEVARASAIRGNVVGVRPSPGQQRLLQRGVANDSNPVLAAKRNDLQLRGTEQEIVANLQDKKKGQSNKQKRNLTDSIGYATSNCINQSINQASKQAIPRPLAERAAACGPGSRQSWLLSRALLSVARRQSSTRQCA